MTLPGADLLPGADEVTARARLERLLAIDVEPTLSTEDIDELLASARRTDAAGLVPTATGWTPTWDLDAAAADGWEIKAGRASGAFPFAEDGQRFDPQKVYDQCMAMARLYRRGSGSSRVHSQIVEDAVTRANRQTLPLA